jgi:hypothetical protein
MDRSVEQLKSWMSQVNLLKRRTMESNSFKYSPLTLPGEIRVLDLKQQNDTSALVEVNMRHIVLEDPPEMTMAAQTVEFLTKSNSPTTYHALSYAWGDEKDKRPIRVNGFQVLVTANLESALRHIQTRKVTLWVDAVCIDQTNVAEKNAQLRLMKNIYKCAMAVFVWFGEERPTTTLAIKFLAEHITVDPARGSIKHDLDTTRNDPKCAPAWDAIGQDLLKRPWWRRIWVIQEIALARRATIFCGRSAFPWNMLVVAVQFARDHNMQIFHKTATERAKNNFQENLKWKAEYRYKHARGMSLPLTELLINNISCYATNPRDMIFALQGLATDTADAPEIQPSYDQSVKDVYTGLVKFHIRKYNTLDIICASKHPKREEHNLPSWVPDWSNLRENLSTLLPTLAVEGFQDGRYAYRASHALPPIAHFSDHDSALRVSSIPLDTITILGAPCLNIETMMSTIESWLGLITDGPYIAGGTLLDAFNTSLCGERTRSGHRAAPGARGLEPAILTAQGADLGIPDSYRAEQNLSPAERREFWVRDTLQSISFVSMMRRLLVTREGYVGVGPVDAEVGDEVVVLVGCSVPVVLRERKDGGWRFVGEAYVAGIMDGEILGGLGEGRRRDVVLR